MPKVIARVNDPRNQAHFDLLGISPTVCATLEHHGADRARGARSTSLVHLLELRKENLEIVEVQIDEGSPSARQARRAARAAGGLAPDLGHAATARRRSRSADASSSPGDQVLAILQPGKEDELRQVLLKK